MVKIKNFDSSDLIINSVILPDNIDDIKIGDDFEIKWEIIRFATAYNDRNNELMDILLDMKIEFKGNNLITEKKYTDRIPTGKRIIPYIITKRNTEFDIISKLYEVKYLGLQKKLKFEAVTKHRVRSEVSNRVFDDNKIKKKEYYINELGEKKGFVDELGEARN